MFNEFLENTLDGLFDCDVKNAMSYSLNAGGKRLRPKLIIAMVKGFNCDETLAYAAGASLEMIHTYSLIHDDLPCMDNDDYRRGKKTCHKMFNEPTAMLAGDGLLTYSFEYLLNSDYDNEQKIKCLKVLSHSCGANGMIYGQEIDILNEFNTNIDITQLKKIHEYKTGKLFSCALMLGAIITNNDEYCDLLNEIGVLLGLAFQIQDDILDCTSSFEVLGKAIGSDEKQNKSTYVTLLGVSDAQILLNEIYDNILVKFDEINFNKREIEILVNQMRNRDR